MLSAFARVTDNPMSRSRAFISTPFQKIVASLITISVALVPEAQTTEVGATFVFPNGNALSDHSLTEFARFAMFASWLVGLALR